MMRRIVEITIVFMLAGMAWAQSCAPGGGVTCTTNLDLWLPPLGYQNWNVVVNANWNTLDAAIGAGGVQAKTLSSTVDPPTAPCSTLVNNGTFATSTTLKFYQCSNNNSGSTYAWNLLAGSSLIVPLGQSLTFLNNTFKPPLSPQPANGTMYMGENTANNQCDVCWVFSAPQNVKAFYNDYALIVKNSFVANPQQAVVFSYAANILTVTMPNSFVAGQTIGFFNFTGDLKPLDGAHFLDQPFATVASANSTSFTVNLTGMGFSLPSSGSDTGIITDSPITADTVMTDAYGTGALVYSSTFGWRLEFQDGNDSVILQPTGPYQQGINFAPNYSGNISACALNGTNIPYGMAFGCLWYDYYTGGFHTAYNQPDDGIGNSIVERTITAGTTNLRRLIGSGTVYTSYSDSTGDANMFLWGAQEDTSGNYFQAGYYLGGFVPGSTQVFGTAYSSANYEGTIANDGTVTNDDYAIVVGDTGGSGGEQVQVQGNGNVGIGGNLMSGGGDTDNGDLFVSSGVGAIEKYMFQAPLIESTAVSCTGSTPYMKYDGTCSSSNFISTIQITIGTGTIGANSCSTLQTASMPGLLTTSSVKFTPASDFHTTTGWSAAGSTLYFFPVPTSGSLTYYVCNNSSSSIAPGASTTWNVSAQ